MTKQEWLKKNGYADNGDIYLILGNTYFIKDELSKSNFKYSSLLKWYGANGEYELPEGYSYKIINFNDVFLWDEVAETPYLKPNAKEYINNIYNSKPILESQYVGQIGDRLHALKLQIYDAFGSSSPFGYKWTYIFKDESGNFYLWVTTTQQTVSNGMLVTLDGTVKNHIEYKTLKTTILTHCRMEIDS